MRKISDDLKLKLRQVNIPDLIWVRLSELADKRNVSKSELCREAIINFLKREKK